MRTKASLERLTESMKYENRGKKNWTIAERIRSYDQRWFALTTPEYLAESMIWITAEFQMAMQNQ